MGFWREALEIAQDVTSLGGTARLRDWTGRRLELMVIYDRLQVTISERNKTLTQAVIALRRQVKKSTIDLRKASRVLDPLKQWRQGAPSHGALPAAGLLQHRGALARSAGTTSSSEIMYSATGIAAGTAVAGGSWAAVQVAAHASTGAAMAALHGAAASNAGWAWFGGGSLATGGGGMALGHFVLPGVGLAVAVGVSSALSHIEANRVKELCGELSKANESNKAAVARIDADLRRVTAWSKKLEYEGQDLSDAVRRARRMLFRFGLLSHIFRIIRFGTRGEYYTSEEMLVVDRLAVRVDSFLTAFRTL